MTDTDNTTTRYRAALVMLLEMLTADRGESLWDTNHPGEFVALELASSVAMPLESATRTLLRGTYYDPTNGQGGTK